MLENVKYMYIIQSLQTLQEGLKFGSGWKWKKRNPSFSILERVATFKMVEWGFEIDMVSHLGLSW